MDRKEQAGFDDQQGTRVGASDAERTPAKHSESPPDRPERQTGVGAEATEGTSKTGEDHDRQHRGGYGGAGGAPVTSSDKRQKQ